MLNNKSVLLEKLGVTNSSLDKVEKRQVDDKWHNHTHCKGNSLFIFICGMWPFKMYHWRSHIFLISFFLVLCPSIWHLKWYWSLDSWMIQGGFRNSVQLFYPPSDIFRGSSQTLAIAQQSTHRGGGHFAFHNDDEYIYSTISNR